MCVLGVTFIYMRSFYHENHSIISIEEARRHTDNMGRQVPNPCLCWKGSDSKIQNLISPWLSCAFIFLYMEFWAVAYSGESLNSSESTIFTEWYATRWPQYKCWLKISASDDSECLCCTSDFGTEVNCNSVTQYVQYSNYFKLFKFQAILIHSLAMLYFRSQINAVGSIHIPWLAQYHRPTVNCILGGCLKNEEWTVGESKHFSFTPKHADQFWHPPGILLNTPWNVISE